jgi:hypothetical protein
MVSTTGTCFIYIFVYYLRPPPKIYLFTIYVHPQRYICLLSTSTPKDIFVYYLRPPPKIYLFTIYVHPQRSLGVDVDETSACGINPSINTYYSVPYVIFILRLQHGLVHFTSHKKNISFKLCVKLHLIYR